MFLVSDLNYVLQNKSDDLDISPRSLEDLKSVLSCISDIKVMSLDVEMKIKDIQEKYRTLLVYDIKVHYYISLSCLSHVLSLSVEGIL